jgi:hypothetical protein
MILTHLSLGMAVALVAASCALLAGHPWWSVIGSYSLAGNVGLLASALMAQGAGKSDKNIG